MPSSNPLLRNLSTARYLIPRQPQSFHPAPPILTTRNFSQTINSRYPRKDSQDRGDISTEATEYSKSGTDDGAARQEEAAFDPKQTDPEDEKTTAGEGTEESGNPLEVSPANPEVSNPRGQQEGGAESSAGGEGKKQSGGGSPAKGKKID